jgi:type 1 fimbria pilin
VSKPRQQDAWAEAWAERYPAPKEKKSTVRSRLSARYGRGPWLLGSAIALGVLLVPAFAIAQGGGQQTFSSSARYTVIARNGGTGGATAQTCKTSPGQPACENNVNFGTNYAATYRTTGPTAAYFQTSGSGQATPFQLSPNATGEVQYLNASMVGGLTPQQLFANYQQINSTSSSVSGGDGTTTSATVTCPAGTNIISQSGAVSQSANSNQGQATLRGVTPTSATSATAVGVVTGPPNANATFTITAYAVCAQT